MVRLAEFAKPGQLYTCLYIHFFQESTGNDSSWIPVLSADGTNEPPKPSTDDQLFLSKMISVVEKSLKIGVPVFIALFTGSFFAVGFCLKARLLNF